MLTADTTYILRLSPRMAERLVINVDKKGVLTAEVTVSMAEALVTHRRVGTASWEDLTWASFLVLLSKAISTRGSRARS